MTYLNETKGPRDTLRVYVRDHQPPKVVADAIEWALAQLEAPAPRVASVTPLPFAAPAGCTCGVPAPILHTPECPMGQLIAECDGLKRTLAGLVERHKDALRAADAKAVEQADHWAGELARAVAAAQGPALVELLACLENAAARTEATSVGCAQVPIAFWEALLEAHAAYERSLEAAKAKSAQEGAPRG